MQKECYILLLWRCSHGIEPPCWCSELMIVLAFILSVVRLTPAYGCLLLLTATQLWYMWDGPMHPRNEFRNIDPACAYNWWINLLWLSNVIHTTDQVRYKLLQLKAFASHTTHKTAKNASIFHTHHVFFAQLQRFFQQFYIWTTIFTTIFFAKIFAVLCVVCNGVKAPYCN